MSEKNKGDIPVYAYGDEDFWYDKDYIHEIRGSKLKGMLAHKYWLGVAVGMSVTAAAFAIGFVFFL